MKENPRLMSLIEHLGELRSCLLRSLLALAVGTALTLYFSKEIFELLTRPLTQVLPPERRFMATTPFEAYVVYFKTAALAGFLLAAPYIALQIWRFISPGLYRKEKR